MWQSRGSFIGLRNSLRRPALLSVLLTLLLSCATLTPEEEQRLAAEQIEAIDAELSVLRDRRVQEYLEALIAKLEPGTGDASEFQVHVVRSDAFNAFAIAGGHIYLTTAVILGCRNVAELSSILAHEMGHIEARHVAENYRRFRNSSSSAELSGILLALLTGNPFLAGAGDLAANFGSTLFITSHTREAERDADELAFRYMLAAGYDPRSQLTLLARLRAASADSEAALPFLQTHPLPAERVEAANARLQTLTDFTGLIVNDSGQLQSLQSYLVR